MTGKFNYAVVGAGRQGTASAYDMAKWGDAASVLLADYDGEAAAGNAERINKLLGVNIATSAQIDVSDHDALVKLLKPVDVFICGTPFVYIIACAEAAIEAGTSLVDFGGHTDTVKGPFVQTYIAPLIMQSGARRLPTSAAPATQRVASNWWRSGA